MPRDWMGARCTGQVRVHTGQHWLDLRQPGLPDLEPRGEVVGRRAGFAGDRPDSVEKQRWLLRNFRDRTCAHLPLVYDVANWQPRRPRHAAAPDGVVPARLLALEWPSENSDERGMTDDWLLRVIRRGIVGERRTRIDDRDVTYRVFRWDDSSPDPIGANDRDGIIYVSERVLHADARRADLTALHEQIELQLTARGRSHAYAHRHAYVEELLAARRILAQPPEVQRYVHWKIEQYADWKVFDRQEVIARLCHVLATASPKKGELHRIIAAYPR